MCLKSNAALVIYQLFYIIFIAIFFVFSNLSDSIAQLYDLKTIVLLYYGSYVVYSLILITIAE